MTSFNVSCTIPDQPGSIGLVASQIGSMKGQIVAVRIAEQRGPLALDELEVELQDSSNLDLLKNKIEETEGVHVVSIVPKGEVVKPNIEEVPTGAIWFEMLADDLEAASDYYETAFGWSIQSAGLPCGDGYRLISVSEDTVPFCAIAKALHAERGTVAERGGSIPYIAVAEVEELVLSIKDAGGDVRTPPGPTQGNTGTYAVVADPWGNRLGLWSA